FRQLDLLRYSHGSAAFASGQCKRCRARTFVTADKRQPGAVIGRGLVVGINMIEVRVVGILKLQRIDWVAANFTDKGLQFERKVISLASPIKVTARGASQFAQQSNVGVGTYAKNIETRPGARVVRLLKPVDDCFGPG